jgi:hypothetical protein
MVLKLRLTPRLQLSLQCTCCGQMFNEEKRNETVVDVAIFGVVDPYAVCPVCLQMTDAVTIRQDPEYRRKARVEMFQRYGVVVRTRWNPDYSAPPAEAFDEPLRARRKTRDD